ncbi:hypothetical protein ACFVUW_19200 [Streptomyces xiamenensis]|uniref:hypothetical protein n=1 Tax=Streptomyces xiamenensis TaxID=408015 RepID=UPI0036EE404C
MRVGQAWATNLDTARTIFGEIWRDSWVYHLLIRSSVRPGVAFSAEEIAKAMRPYQTSKLAPWMHLVDWLVLARYVERDSDGTLRLSEALTNDVAAATLNSEQDVPPASAPDPAGTSLGLVLLVNMDQLTHLSADDYGAVMRSLATIYEVLSRQRARDITAWPTCDRPFSASLFCARALACRKSLPRHGVYLHRPWEVAAPCPSRVRPDLTEPRLTTPARP